MSGRAEGLGVEIRAACSPGEVRVAATRDGTLLDYAVWRPGAPDGVGDLHRGRVSALVPAMAGAFVTLADAEGFLPDSEGAKGLTEGTVLPVRVTRAAQGGKGPRLTARVTVEEAALADAGPVARLRRGPDAVTEFAAGYEAAPVLVDEPGIAALLRRTLGERVVVTSSVWADGLAEQVDCLAEPVISLAGGARLSIHPTPALVAIDIDSGSTAASRRDRNTQHRHVNEGAIPALVRQIRLRNLSGAIVVDFAGLSPRRRAALGPALGAALAADPLHPRFLGFTALGLAEIVRPRVHPPLHEVLTGPHAAGLVALRRIAAGFDPAFGGLPILRAAPAVVRALESDPVALADLARRTGYDLVLRSDPSLPADGWLMEHAYG